MLEMAIQEVKRIFAEQASPSMHKLTDDALSDAIFGGSQEAITGLNNVSYYFLEDVLTEMAPAASSDDTVERNL